MSSDAVEGHLNLTRGTLPPPISDRLPVERLRQHPVRYNLRLLIELDLFDELVRFFSVAAQMRKLEVADVRRMSALVYGYDVIYARRERVREF